MRTVAGVITAVVVVLGIVAFAAVRAVGAADAKPAAAVLRTPTASAQGVTKVKDATSAMRHLTAGGLKRSYEVIAPDKALPKSAPIIVMLSGLGATLPGEIGRDRLVDYASADKAEVIYPVAVGESWNAGGCCGEAGTKKVNDLAFLKALVASVDPGRSRPIYVVGYSNGARLAYLVTCDDPALFDGYAMVKGEPTADCALSKPVNILQIASVNDPEVPYQPGDKGSLKVAPVTTLVSRLRTEEQCPAKGTVTHSGSMTQTAWTGCAGGARLALAAWSGGVHAFPRPPASVPAASQVAWAFFTNTPLAPLPS
jgi:polyhydroxybutyrate depolymerase